MTSPGGERKTVGLLVVGALGMTGSAALAGVLAMQRGVVETQYGSTSHPAFSQTPLPVVADISVGGWDFLDASLGEAVRNYRHLPDAVQDAVEDIDIPLFDGLWTPLDFPLDSHRVAVQHPTSLNSGAITVAQDITSFRRTTGSECVVVVYAGTPWNESRYSAGADDVPRGGDMCPSALMYAQGAIEAGAHFIDFTPSRTLEYTFLHSQALARDLILAGRDGSTGQTMLKVTCDELFRRRGIEIVGWYSTNLIGNRDGYVLSHPEYAATKIADKTDALPQPGPERHRVNIEYLPPWGDRKESWDAIECATWLGAPLSVRVNWRGHDSQLAGAMILDLARLTDRAASVGLKGLVPHLGFFFKRPLQRERTSLSERWMELVDVLS